MSYRKINMVLLLQFRFPLLYLEHENFLLDNPYLLNIIRQNLIRIKTLKWKK